MSEKKNVNTLLDFFFFSFFFDSACPRLKTSIYVLDSGDFFFLMSTFFLINCWKTFLGVLLSVWFTVISCITIYWNGVFIFYLRKNLRIFLCLGKKKACCNVRKPFKSGSVIANCRCTLQQLEKKVL